MPRDKPFTGRGFRVLRSAKPRNDNQGSALSRQLHATAHHRRRFDLDHRFRLDQRGDRNHGHGREMPAEGLAIDRPQFLEAGAIGLDIRDVPGQAHDILDASAAGLDHRSDVEEGLA